ncbi:TetR family transcriptional regulator [Bifidobacterium samirii]|uniref:TetR family transcriptional regulator n=1 Tax=Bifidobacterium samirii TaxID=2306974 RepID=A0A430FUM4_9BIFI|nr:TetR family transcriptional regulator [Bifidobacterium samirii]
MSSIASSTESSTMPASSGAAKPSSTPAVDPHDRFMIVAVITVGAFVALLNQTVMSPALPALMRDFAIDTGTVQWVTSIYMLVSGIMVPISGYLIDRFSTRRLFAGALGMFTIGTVLCALAPGFGVLIAGRVLQAAASGILLPLVAVVPMLVYPLEQRGTAMGMAGIVMAAGPAIGPVIGGMVIDRAGWRPMFWGVAALAAIILAAGVMLLRNVGVTRRARLDVASVVLSTVAFGGILYGFSTASTAGWATPVVIAPIAVGLVALVAFLHRQTRLDEPLLHLDTLRVRVFRHSALLVTLINASVAVTNVTLPIFIQNVLGESATVTGMVMLPAAAVGIVLSPVSGMLFDRFGPRGVGIGGLALMTLSLGMLGTVGTGTPVWFVAVFCMLQATGQALANMPINTWGVNALHVEKIAQGNAIANTGRQIAAAVATSLLVTAQTSVTAARQADGAREAAAQGIAVSYLLCAAIACAALVVCVATVRRTHTADMTVEEVTL